MMLELIKFSVPYRDGSSCFAVNETTRADSTGSDLAAM